MSLVRLDPVSEVAYRHLVEIIAWEMSARLAAGDRVKSPDAVIDHFQVIPRTDGTPRFRWGYVESLRFEAW